MHRQPSPLLHDYKSPMRRSESKSQPLRWFAAGLGVPLAITAAFFLTQNDSDSVAAGTSVEMAAAVAAPVEASITPFEDLTTADVEQSVYVPDEIAVDAATSPALEASPNTSPAPQFHPPLMLSDVAGELLRITVRSGDTLDRIFRRNKLDLGDLAQIARLPDASTHLRLLKPGDEIEIRHEDGDLLSFYRQLELTSALEIAREEGAFVSRFVDRPVETRQRVAYGRIETSLFESGADAGLSDKMIMNLAGIFAWDVDFVLDIRTDDNYYIVYEELWQDGEFVADGEVVAAEFNNDGRTYQAVRYISKDGRSDYFTPEGLSVRKAFVRAPVDFTRISSQFNPNRRHPILNTIRAHRGVDYAAPRGTPVKAAGDGKIIFRGVKNGYGNTVILQHGGNITTLYAHLNSFDRNAGMGKRVAQGQTIAYVGDTGLATAPHLHYEYRLNGVHRNPRTVQLPQADPIKAEYMEDFLAKAAPILEELDEFKRTRVASASAD